MADSSRPHRCVYHRLRLQQLHILDWIAWILRYSVRLFNSATSIASKLRLGNKAYHYWYYSTWTRTTRPVSLKLCINREEIVSVLYLSFIAGWDECDYLTDDILGEVLESQCAETAKQYSISELDGRFGKELNMDISIKSARSRMYILFMEYTTLFRRQVLKWILQKKPKNWQYCRICQLPRRNCSWNVSHRIWNWKSTIWGIFSPVHGLLFVNFRKDRTHLNGSEEEQKQQTKWAKFWKVLIHNRGWYYWSKK